RARLPDGGTAAPESPAAGLTLPQAVLLLQPVLRCWTGRCPTCKQPMTSTSSPYFIDGSNKVLLEGSSWLHVERPRMPRHNVELEISTPLDVGRVDFEIHIRSDDKYRGERPRQQGND